MHGDAKFVELLMQRGEGLWGPRILAFCHGLEARGWVEILSTSNFLRIFLRQGKAVCLAPLDPKEPLDVWLEGRISISKRIASKVLVLGICQRKHVWSEQELQQARRKKAFQSTTFGSLSLSDGSLRVPAATSEWSAFLDQASRILARLDESPVVKDPAPYERERAEEMQRQSDYDIASRRANWVTRSWAACSLLMYLISWTLTGTASWKWARLGAILPGLPWGQESWRLATASWTQPNVWVLVFSLIYLFDIGATLEGLVGRGAMISLLVGSALAGGFAGCLYSAKFVLCSGYAVVAGLCGASLLLSFLRRKQLSKVLVRNLRSGSHHSFAFLIFTICLQNSDGQVFLAGFLAGLLIALASGGLRQAGWIGLVVPFWGLLGLAGSWGRYPSPFAFPQKTVELANGSKILVPEPFRPAKDKLIFLGPGGYLWLATKESSPLDLARQFKSPVQHLPGGDWTVVDLPPHGEFHEVGLFGYASGKLVAMKAGSVGEGAEMRAYFEELLKFTQGRLEFPAGAQEKVQGLEPLVTP